MKVRNMVVKQQQNRPLLCTMNMLYKTSDEVKNYFFAHPSRCISCTNTTCRAISGEMVFEMFSWENQHGLHEWHSQQNIKLSADPVQLRLWRQFVWFPSQHQCILVSVQLLPPFRHSSICCPEFIMTKYFTWGEKVSNIHSGEAGSSC